MKEDEKEKVAPRTEPLAFIMAAHCREREKYEKDEESCRYTHTHTHTLIHVTVSKEVITM